MGGAKIYVGAGIGASHIESRFVITSPATLEIKNDDDKDVSTNQKYSAEWGIAYNVGAGISFGYEF